MSLWYHYWAMNARGNVVRSWGAPLKLESRDEKLGIRLGDIRHLTSILQLSGIALYKNRCSGAFINRRLEMFLPALFHTAGALSAPSGHLLLEGRAFHRNQRAIRWGRILAPLLHLSPFLLIIVHINFIYEYKGRNSYEKYIFPSFHDRGRCI